MASRSSRSVSSASLPTIDASATLSSSFVDPFAAEKEAKAVEIAAACRDRRLTALINLAKSDYGLINDTLRREAWPLLLGCDQAIADEQPSWKDLPPHRDEGQVDLDVRRAFVYYPHESEKLLDRRKEDLSDVIVEVLRRHPALCYFQGYHDIVQVFLLVLGARDAPAAVTRLSLLRIRDFMLPTLDPAISHLELLPPILQGADPVLYDHLPKMQPFFALGATITLFAHVIQAYGDIARLFDFFLASDTIVPVYFFAAVLLSRKDELLEIEKEETDMFHATLGKLPSSLDLDLLIKQTEGLYDRLRPESLRGWAWWRVSSSSVLKTINSPEDIHKATLEEGLVLFQKQEVELRRKKTFEKALQSARNARTRLWYYRRPGALGLAFAIGVFAFWLGQKNGATTRFTNHGSLNDLLKRLLGFMA